MAIFNSKLLNHHRLEFNLNQSRPSTLIALSVNPFPAQTRLKRIDSTLKGLRTSLAHSKSKSHLRTYKKETNNQAPLQEIVSFKPTIESTSSPETMSVIGKISTTLLEQLHSWVSNQQPSWNRQPHLWGCWGSSHFVAEAKWIITLNPVVQ